MNDNSTDSSATTGKRESGDLLCDSTVSGDQYATSLLTSGRRSTGSNFLVSPRQANSRPRQKNVSVQARQASRALFNSCIDSLDRALTLEDEFFQRNNAIEQFRDTLATLWDQRDRWQEAFAELINMLQGILAKCSVEDFDTNQLICVRAAVQALRDAEEIDDAFANQVTKDLLRGGLDVFRELNR